MVKWVVQEASMEEGGGEMRFRLPAAPSPGPLMFLLAACREVARAGGHTTGAVAVQLLEWDLGNAVLEAFRCSDPLFMVMHVHLCLTIGQQCCLLLEMFGPRLSVSMVTGYTCCCRESLGPKALPSMAGKPPFAHAPLQ